MFTGIIESSGRVESLVKNGSNRTFTLSSPLAGELKADQSVSHDGVCLTVESVSGNQYQVTAVEETLSRSILNDWIPGYRVNLERCLPFNGRLDGHLVQGHVDCTAVCLDKTDNSGSWVFRFDFPDKYKGLVIDKGSIAVNGISLTCFDTGKDKFSVAVIPFTLEHTNIGSVEKGSRVNIEFDLIGKYVLRMMENRLPAKD